MEVTLAAMGLLQRDLIEAAEVGSRMFWSKETSGTGRLTYLNEEIDEAVLAQDGRGSRCNCDGLSR